MSATLYGPGTPPALVTYFLHDPEVQRLKIGRTTNLRKRLRGLQSARGSHALQVLQVVPGDVEREWHDRFKPARLAGEWFALTADVTRTLRQTFGLRLRTPRERLPRLDPQRTRDWLDVLHDHTGLGLRYAEDWDGLHDIPEGLDSWILTVALGEHDCAAHCDDTCADCPEDCLGDDTCACPCEGDDDTCAVIEDGDDDVDRLCRALNRTIDRMIGWCAGDPRPGLANAEADARWQDLWLVYWRPTTLHGHAQLRNALGDAEWAVEDTDGGLYRIRFHAVLVDATTGHVDFDPYPEPDRPPVTEAELRDAADRLATREA